MKKIFLLLFFTSFVFSVSKAQNNEYWTKNSQTNVAQMQKTDRLAMPKIFEVFTLNFNLLKSKLAIAPSRENFQSQYGVEISFPNPSGTLDRFRVFKAQIMHPELAVRYSEINSYIGIGIDNPTATIRFSTTLFGLHTMLFSGKNETVFIDPYTTDLLNYVVYYKSQVTNPNGFSCDTRDNDLGFRSGSLDNPNEVQASNGLFRKYRLAISTTIEYSNFHINQAGLSGGTDAQKRTAVLNAMVVTMTRVNGLFERDLAITLELISNNDILISIGSDSFSNTNASAMLTENQNAITSIIGSTGFDIGHIFSTGGGGVASLGSVCSDNVKAKGVTGSNSPVNDAFNIDYVAHEMGHQFGATHTFNGDTGSCAGGNRSNITAVEPGSGTTIMAYAGICAPLNVQNNSDAHFSVVSMAQIDAFVANNGNCSVNTPNNNAAPVIQTLTNYTIPIATPFVLTGNATDANNPNSLTYCWEQTDIQISTQPPSEFSETGPNFRSRTPSSSPLRYMPRLTDVVNSAVPTWEVLPVVPRIMNFALTVRDNASPLGGQTKRANMTVTFAGTAAFSVTSPNISLSWPAGSNQNVTWEVAGTTANGINTPYVDIFLSTNGGLSFPILLASRVPNDGSETILVPNNVGINNRIMVMGNNNIFYDISDSNFSIAAPSATQGIAFNGVAGEQNKQSCSENSLPFSFNYVTLGGFSAATTLSVAGNPSGSTVAFSPASISTTGTVTLTVGNLNNVAAGLYPMIVTATSGAIVKTLNLYLEKPLIPATIITSPANLSVLTPSNINLNWNANAGVSQYVVQISTTNAFSSFVVNQTVNSNSYLFNSASSSVDYFWRIASKIGDCVGVFSAPFKFSTTFCGTSNSSDVPKSISITAPSTVESILTIPNASNVVISDVNVNLNISHTWINDLTVSLISPIGTIVQLFTNQCSPSQPGFQNAIATFDDASTLVLTCGATPPSVSGRVIPSQALSAFNGQNSQGVWKLRVFDKSNGDGGQINSWNIEICSNQAPLSVKSENKIDFAVYPNPNNLISDKVSIAVYDMRGRTIFNKDYKSQINFNQNINLDNIQSGVYLLNVIDGDRKETKRIVIQ